MTERSEQPIVKHEPAEPTVLDLPAERLREPTGDDLPLDDEDMPVDDSDRQQDEAGLLGR